MDETEDVIRAGDVLHVYTAEWNIWVSKADFLLLVKDSDRVIKAYDIGIGAQDRTPVGTFHINVKQSDPAWDKPGADKIPAGHPDNVLGTRWMGLKPIDETPKTLKSYGIHGTTEPDTIGTAASQGCVRMLNSDVEELYRIVPRRTPVVIED
jgi:lipoprotein-anchoring transpeptidase ErfK/SrfK